MAEATLYSLLTVLIFTLWPLARAREVRAAALYRAALGQARACPLAALSGGDGRCCWRCLLATAAWFSGNLRLTLWTAGGIAGALRRWRWRPWRSGSAARALRGRATGAARARLGAGGDRRAGQLGRAGGAVAGAGAVGAGRGRPDRQQPARAIARDLPSARRPSSSSTSRRTRSRVPRPAGGRSGGEPRRSRADAARHHHAINGRPAAEVAPAITG